MTASNDQTARVWDAGSGKEIAILKGHAHLVKSAKFSPDGERIVTAAGIRLEPEDATARLWDAASGKEIAVLAGHRNGLDSVAFSTDGRRLVTSGDTTARLWDAASGKELAVLAGHRTNVLATAFNPDGTRVVTASADHSARLWDAATGRRSPCSWDMRALSTRIVQCRRRRVVTASFDKTARLWDAATGKAIAVLVGHADSVRDAEFNADGTRVVTASLDNTARVWRLFRTTQELIDHAKTAVPRCLTRVQRQKAFLDAAPPAWCITGSGNEANPSNWQPKWPYHAAEWKQWLIDAHARKDPPLPNMR